MYQTASKIVVVTDSFKKVIIHKYGIDESKFSVVKNGVNTSLFVPRDKDTGLIKSLGLENKVIIGYIGTHGMAHALDFILKCAAKVQDEQIHFLFLGDGAKKEELLQLKENLGLTNVTMLPSVKKKEVVNYISIIDIALVNLKKSDTFKHVIPSKIFELCGMHKPILLGVEGEAKKLIEDYRVGETFEPENEIEFLDGVDKILNNKDTYIKGYTSVVKDFDRVNLADKMITFILR